MNKKINIEQQQQHFKIKTTTIKQNKNMYHNNIEKQHPHAR